MNKLTKIPTKKYQGYVWLSDEKYPTILLDKEYDFSTVKENQFVIEALLWYAQEETSIMVRHTGKYHIQEFKLKELPPEHELVDKVYLPHRLGEKVKNVCFKQLWIPEPDAHCEEMPVMTMKALIFTGFNCSTEKN
jgi:CRISPR type III-associated protein (TIGR04423 family)